MTPVFSSLLLASRVAGKVVLTTTSKPSHVVVLSGVEPGLAVVDQDYYHGQVLIFDDQATRKGGEPAAILKPHFESQCAAIGDLFVLEDGALAVGTSPFRLCSSYGTNSAAVEIYGAPTLMSGGDPDVVLSGLIGTYNGIDVMTQLSNGQLVAGSSIFVKEALVQGGNATAVLDNKYAFLDEVLPFQGGIAYTSRNMNSLLIYDDAAISGEDLRPALEIGGAAGTAHDFSPAKWGIPGWHNFCPETSLVFEDGALAVLGTCHNAENATLTLFESINFEARTMRNSTFSMPKHAKMLALPDGRIAVGVTTVSCGEGYVQVFEESALRSGGEPSLVLQTSGDVISMAAFQDGRLAVSTEGGGRNDLQWCNKYTIDIVDVNANTGKSTLRVI